MAATTRPPDISTRPLSVTVERTMAASPTALYRAWTNEYDRWFAEPGSVLMRPEVKAETLVTVELSPADDNGTNLRLTHAGFPDQDACAQHSDAWPNVLAQQDQRIT